MKKKVSKHPLVKRLFPASCPGISPSVEVLMLLTRFLHTQVSWLSKDVKIEVISSKP